MIYAYIQYVIFAAAFALIFLVLLVYVWQLPRVIRMYSYFRKFGDSRIESIKLAWKWVN